MTTKFIAACAVGALMGSAAMLTQAAGAPSYDAKKAQYCVQDGVPTSEPNHNGDSPDYWCCYVNWSGTLFLSETVRYDQYGYVVRRVPPASCANSPP